MKKKRDLWEAVREAERECSSIKRGGKRTCTPALRGRSRTDRTHQGKGEGERGGRNRSFKEKLRQKKFFSGTNEGGGEKGDAL